MSEHIKSACDDLFVYVALLFSGMIVHGFVQVEYYRAIPKGKNTNPTDSSNYRSIALGSLLGKVFC